MPRSSARGRPVPSIVPVVACALVVWVTALGAGEGGFERWRWIRFGTSSGLPAPDVREVAFTAAGTPWAVAGGAVARYDGFAWHRVPELDGDPHDARHRLRALDGDRMAVVVGTTVYLADRDGVREVPVHDADGAVGIAEIGSLPGGRLAVVTDRGTVGRRRVGAIDPATGVYQDIALPPGRSINPSNLLWTAPDGSIFVHLDYDLHRFRHGRWSAVFPDGPTRVEGLACSGRSECIASVRLPYGRHGIWRWSGADEARRVGGPGGGVPRLLVASEAGRFVGVFDDGGVRRHEGLAWSGIVPLPLEVREVEAIALDARGDLWVASGSGAFVERRSVETWSERVAPDDDLENRVHDFAVAPDGTLWVATADGLRAHRPGGRVEVVDRIGDRRLGVVIAVAVAPDGTVWASDSLDRGGVLRFDGRTWRSFGTSDGFDGGSVHRIAIDAAGDPWFLTLGPLDAAAGPAGNGGGIVRFRGGAFERPLRGLGAAEPGRVYEMAEAADGSRWFATVSGLCRLADGEWTCLAVGDGLRMARVFAVAAAPDGTIWFAHDEHGVGYLRDGEVRYLSGDDGLDNTQVRDLAVDARGWVWMTTGGGLAVARDGTVTMVPCDVGRPNVRLWPVLVDGDRVHVGSQGRGFEVLDVAQVDRTPPRVEIAPPVVSDGSVWLRWRALSHDGWIDPGRVRSRWRADGGEWSAWAVRDEVRIDRPGAGDHRYEVQALGLLGDPSDPVAAVAHVPPAWWARPGVAIPIAVLTGIVAVLAVTIVARRRRHGRELRERERRFRELVETAPDPIWTLDARGCILDLNRAAERALATDRGSAAGRAFAAFLDPGERARFEEVFVAADAEGARPETHSFDVPIAGGPATALEVILRRAVDADGSAVVRCFGRDITDRRRLEERLRRAETMEAIGQLAGGIAHDFGNLMMAVTGYSQFVLRDMAADDPARADVERILRAGERAAGVTRQLMDFSRRRARRTRPVDLSRLVRDLLPMLRSSVRDDVVLVAGSGAGVGIVDGDPGQLQSVLFNLVSNAQDAMPAGGTLRIDVRDAEVDAAEAERLGVAAPGRFTVLEVADDGEGMDETTRARMFEPFFTTKPHGRGTGLGLASVYGIVQQAGGAIDVRSSPGAGTTIRILFRHLPGERTEVAIAPEIADATLGSGRTVLVVDDSPEILGYLGPLLRAWGFDVLEARDGREALERADRCERSIDVLVTDVVMPHVSGPELATRLRERDPGVRVLFMSGYVDHPAAFEGTRAGSRDRLVKPFGPVDLHEALVRVLA